MPIAKASHTAKMCLDFLEQNGMNKVPHPSYSADLAPSGFYLFVHVKQSFTGHKFSNQGAVLNAVQDIPRGIKKPPCIGFFSLGWRNSNDALQSVEAT
jgi:hypothetical protein